MRMAPYTRQCLYDSFSIFNDRNKETSLILYSINPSEGIYLKANTYLPLESFLKIKSPRKKQ